MKRSLQAVLAVVLTASCTIVFAEGTITLPMKPVLTLAAAHIVMDAAIHDAEQRGTRGGIAVVDDGGHVLIFERMDNASIASSKIAPEKARTAAQFRAPSKNFENAINSVRPAFITAGLNMMSGGEPIVVSGQVVGAVGVSTSTPADDDLIAVTAAHALDNAK